MGKITDALKKAAEVRLERVEKMNRIQEREQLVIKKIGDVPRDRGDRPLEPVKMKTVKLVKG